MSQPNFPQPPAPVPAPRRRRLLWLAALGLVALLAFWVFVKYRQSTAALRPVLFVQTPGSLGDIQFTHDGRLLMTTEGAVSNPMVTFRDADTGQIVRQWPGGVGQKWLSEDGTRLLETDYVPHGPSQSFLRDAVTGHILRQWPGQIGDVRPDFSLMTVSGSVVSVPGTPPGRNTYIRPKTGQVVEVETGRVIGQFSLGNGDLSEARLSALKPFLCVRSDSQPSRLLRLPAMTPVLTDLPPLRSLRVTRDGIRAIGISQAGVLHLWSLPSGQHTAIPTKLRQTFWVSELKSRELLIFGIQGTELHWKSVMQVRSADGTRILRSFDESPQAFSPDGRLMAADVAYKTGTCSVWDLETGKRRALLDIAADALGNPTSEGDPGSGHLAFSSDGRHFAYAAQSGLLRFYSPGYLASTVPSRLISTDSGQSVMSFGPGNRYSPSLFNAVVLPDGGVAASGGQDSSRDEQRVQVWHPGQEAWAVKTGTAISNVTRLGVSPDGTQVVGSSQYGIWALNLANRVSLTTPIQNLSDGGQGFTPHGVGQPVWLDGPGQIVTTVSTGDFEDGPIALTRWDAAGQFVDEKTVVPAKQSVGGQTFQIAGVEVSPDGKTLAVLWNEFARQSIGSAGRLELRDTRSGRVLKTLAATLPSSSYTGSQGALGQPAFSPNGKRLAVADDTGGLQVWDTDTGRLLGRLSGTRVDTHSHLVAFAGASLMGGAAGRSSFTPDNRWLAVGRDDGSIYLYSLRSWLPVAQLGQTTDPLRWLAFAPDGHTLYGFTTNGADVLSWPVPTLKNSL